MARTPDADLPVAPEWMALLRTHIVEIGRNEVARLAGIDPSTLHRNVNDKALTYTTAMKLREAITSAYAERASDSVGVPRVLLPPPFVGVVSQGHYELCVIAARLHEQDGRRFGELIERALELDHDSTMDRAVQSAKDRVVDEAKSRISHPLRSLTDEDDRGG